MGTARQARQELTGFAETDSLQSPKWGTGHGAMIGCGNLDRRTTALQGRRGMPTGRPGPLIPWAGMSDAAVRAHALERLAGYLRECTGCALSGGRTTVVVGAGAADADLMFVGEAPGANEDRLGVPFVGQAGTLLDGLLEGIGLARDDVFIANVLKCRPPGNRDPRPEEIEACRGYLEEQVALVQPMVVCSLGNFATKLLSGRPDGISQVHGQGQQVAFGGHDTILYPVFHPAAALYTRSMLGTLEEDFARLPGLIGLSSIADADAEAPETPESPGTREHTQQMDLF